MNTTATVLVLVEILDATTGRPVYLEGSQPAEVLTEAGVAFVAEPRATDYDGTYLVRVDEAWFNEEVDGAEWRSATTWQGLVVQVGPHRLTDN